MVVIDDRELAISTVEMRDRDDRGRTYRDASFGCRRATELPPYYNFYRETFFKCDASHATRAFA